MEKQQMLDVAKEKLAPLETGNVYDFIQHMSLNSLLENPLLVVLFLIVGFYAVFIRSKFVLLALFTAFTVTILVKYTLSPEVVGGELSVSATLPFIAGGLAIGGALLYFTFFSEK